RGSVGARWFWSAELPPCLSALFVTASPSQSVGRIASRKSVVHGRCIARLLHFFQRSIGGARCLTQSIFSFRSSGCGPVQFMFRRRLVSLRSKQVSRKPEPFGSLPPARWRCRLGPYHV